MAWGREGACISQKLELLADKPSFKPPSRHVSQRQIEDFARGLIAPQTPQKLNSDRAKGVVTLPILAGVKGTKVILTAMNLLMLLSIGSLWIMGRIASAPETILATAINLTYIWSVNTDTPRWVYSIWIEGFLFVPLLGKLLTLTRGLGDGGTGGF